MAKMLGDQEVRHRNRRLALFLVASMLGLFILGLIGIIVFE